MKFYVSAALLLSSTISTLAAPTDQVFLQYDASSVSDSIHKVAKTVPQEGVKKAGEWVSKGVRKFKEIVDSEGESCEFFCFDCFSGEGGEEHADS